MAPRIARQAETFGLHEVEEARQRTAASIADPAEIADLLKGPRIQAGLLQVRDEGDIE
ncbi:hypothetical protein SEA_PHRAPPUCCINO_75 [Mycobacterium phage Phrappuccino]|uniref:Uncharacterized protein n=1 Tax=Mycobacterium phage Phrappuccino TaxID=2591223 RepID=A0A514DDR7_9CAUD|nr:hypothetical protein KHQ87_gp075 [Mycobacterium phage Phrappuccino]QDH91750.1 hypothetical protein SEA_PHRAPPUCCINO_75 [Mycobacterium phage Phrappuccino]QIQ63192.1 hypothetical protein SEA_SETTECANDELA_75 [Mycobacterium phage Settecandela]